MRRCSESVHSIKNHSRETLPNDNLMKLAKIEKKNAEIEKAVGKDLEVNEQIEQPVMCNSVQVANSLLGFITGTRAVAGALSARHTIFPPQ